MFLAKVPHVVETWGRGKFVLIPPSTRPKSWSTRLLSLIYCNSLYFFRGRTIVGEYAPCLFRLMLSNNCQLLTSGCESLLGWGHTTSSVPIVRARQAKRRYCYNTEFQSYLILIKFGTVHQPFRIVSFPEPYDTRSTYSPERSSLPGTGLEPASQPRINTLKLLAIRIGRGK